jgi:hypothetical protein
VLGRKADKLQALRDQVAKDLRARRKEIKTLSNRIEVLAKVGELFRALMDKLVLGQVSTIEGLVSEGLRAIFYDQDLSLESEVSQKYNRVSIDFFMRQGLDDVSAIRGHPLESFGGGPSSIASLILRMMTLLKLKRWPVMLLDETLASVSDDYLDQTGLFLRKIAGSAKLDILLVTHKQGYLEHADVAYQGSEELGDDGSWCLALRRLRGATK